MLLKFEDQQLDQWTPEERQKLTISNRNSHLQNPLVKFLFLLRGILHTFLCQNADLARSLAQPLQFHAFLIFKLRNALSLASFHFSSHLECRSLECRGSARERLRSLEQSRAESGLITFQAPQRERSHAILGEHEDILWTTVVLWKHFKTDSQSRSGWRLHWTEVGLRVPTYEVEPVGTCRFLGQILRCGLFWFALLYVPETGRYGWLQFPFHFDASAKVRRAVKPCSDFVSNDQSSHVWRKNGHQDESSASSASFMLSSFSNFETPSPCIFSFFLTPWMPQFRMPQFSKRKTSVTRDESGLITFQAPQKERSHAILGEHEDILWTTVVLWNMSKPILRAAVTDVCIGQKLGYKCQHMRWNLSEPAVFSVKSWDAVCFALLYAPETGRYGWLQCPFHFDASAEVRRAVKQCSDFVSNDQSSTCEGKMDIKTSLQQVQQVSCFPHFQTSKRPHLASFHFSSHLECRSSECRSSARERLPSLETNRDWSRFKPPKKSEVTQF